MQKRFSHKWGKIGPHHLIALILLITAIGIGIYYYQQHQKPADPRPTAPHLFPLEPAVIRETQNNDNLVYGGLPKAASQTSILVLRNIGYFAGYCDDRRNPLWVAYRLDAKEIGHKLKRPSSFKTDMRTLSRVDQKAFSKSGYDRGHMAPNSGIALRYGVEAQLQTFLMSNIVPQTPDLNRRVWARLEKLEDEYANRYGSIWVITGPIFDDHIQLIDNRIEIPDAFYKIIFDEQDNNIRALAFIVPQTVTGKERFEQFLTSINEIERLTGLDFLWPLSPEVQQRLESEVANKLW